MADPNLRVRQLIATAINGDSRGYQLPGEALRDRAVLARTRDVLARAGCETPRLDAELLLANVLGVERARLFIDGERVVAPEHAARFEAMVARRAGREPIAYILGHKAFRHIELEVDPRVLIPRPETELLVETALALPRGARVVEVGTGSGAVALALKHERSDLDVTATDISADALAVAARNAQRLGLELRLRRADLIAGAGGPFDALLANLPYVVEEEFDRLAPEISRYEPRLALVGGSDGLEVVRRLVAQLGAIPFVALEVGAGQAGAVQSLLLDAGARDVLAARDLAGIERVVVARR